MPLLSSLNLREFSPMDSIRRFYRSVKADIGVLVVRVLESLGIAFSTEKEGARW